MQQGRERTCRERMRPRLSEGLRPCLCLDRRGPEILAKRLLSEMESAFRFVAMRDPPRGSQRRNTCSMNCLIGYWITVCTFAGSSSGRISILSVVPGLKWVRMVPFMSALSRCT